MTEITNMEPMLTRRSKSTSFDWMLRRVVRSMQAPPAVGSPSPGDPAPNGPEVRPEGHADKVWLPHPPFLEILWKALPERENGRRPLTHLHQASAGTCAD